MSLCSRVLLWVNIDLHQQYYWNKSVLPHAGTVYGNGGGLHLAGIQPPKPPPPVSNLSIPCPISSPFCYSQLYSTPSPDLFHPVLHILFWRASRLARRGRARLLRGCLYYCKALYRTHVLPVPLLDGVSFLLSLHLFKLRLTQENVPGIDPVERCGTVG